MKLRQLISAALAAALVLGPGAPLSRQGSLTGTAADKARVSVQDTTCSALTSKRPVLTISRAGSGSPTAMQGRTTLSSATSQLTSRRPLTGQERISRTARAALRSGLRMLYGTRISSTRTAQRAHTLCTSAPHPPISARLSPMQHPRRSKALTSS